MALVHYEKDVASLIYFYRHPGGANHLGGIAFFANAGLFPSYLASGVGQ